MLGAVWMSFLMIAFVYAFPKPWGLAVAFGVVITVGFWAFLPSPRRR